jgi:ketol-acid reductoisomerase
MITGYNTDIKVNGETYHIQTEDGGMNNPVIVTLLYAKGAILSSKRMSYADIIKVDRLEEVVKGLMEEQHKAMIKEVKEGKFKDASTKGVTEEAKKDKSLDEMILEYLSKGE